MNIESLKFSMNLYGNPKVLYSDFKLGIRLSQ